MYNFILLLYAKPKKSAEGRLNPY